MAENYGPFDAGPGASFTEDGWGKLMRSMAKDGVIYQLATEITSPYTGPGDNGLRVTLAGGLDYSIGVGAACVHGFLYENTATITRTVSTPPTTAGQSRKDLVILRLDRTANTVTSAILTGTAAVSPVDPTLTKSPTTWEIALARIIVPANAVNLTQVDDIRRAAYDIPGQYSTPLAWAENGSGTGSIGTSLTSILSTALVVPKLLPAGAQIKVEADVFITTATGIGSASVIDGMSNPGATRSINQSASYDAHHVGYDIDPVAGSTRTYRVLAQCLTASQTLTWRAPSIRAELWWPS